MVFNKPDQNKTKKNNNVKLEPPVQIHHNGLDTASISQHLALDSANDELFKETLIHEL